MSREISPSSGRTKETFDPYGHNIPKPYDGQFDGPFEPSPQVPHEDRDNDDMRKENNRYRHGSYRK